MFTIHLQRPAKDELIVYITYHLFHLTCGNLLNTNLCTAYVDLLLNDVQKYRKIFHLFMDRFINFNNVEQSQHDASVVTV